MNHFLPSSRALKHCTEKICKIDTEHNSEATKEFGFTILAVLTREGRVLFQVLLN